jgi:hypothetical protein
MTSQEQLTALALDLRTPVEKFLDQLTPETSSRLRREEVAMDEPRCYWYLVVFHEGKLPDIHKYGDIGSLRAKIMQLRPEVALLSDEVRVMVFYGFRAMTTKPPEPRLLHPGGFSVPLYDPNAPLQIAKDGSLNQGASLPADVVVDEEDDEELDVASVYDEDELLSGPGSADALDMSTSDDTDDEEPAPPDDVPDEEPS